MAVGLSIEGQAVPCQRPPDQAVGPSPPAQAGCCGLQIAIIPLYQPLPWLCAPNPPPCINPPPAQVPVASTLCCSVPCCPSNHPCPGDGLLSLPTMLPASSLPRAHHLVHTCRTSATAARKGRQRTFLGPLVPRPGRHVIDVAHLPVCPLSGPFRLVFAIAIAFALKATAVLRFLDLGPAWDTQRLLHLLSATSLGLRSPQKHGLCWFACAGPKVRPSAAPPARQLPSQPLEDWRAPMALTNFLITLGKCCASAFSWVAACLRSCTWARHQGHCAASSATLGLPACVQWAWVRWPTL